MSGLQSEATGQIVEGLQVKGVDETNWIELPTTLTSTVIPDSRHEAANREIVASHPHIKNFAKRFPIIDKDAEVLILVGADCGKAMQTKVFGSHHPYVHKTALGFALVGPVCRNRSNSRRASKTLKTVHQECHEHLTAKQLLIKNQATNDSFKISDTFVETPDDDMPDLSQEDQEFNEIITNGIRINEKGNLEMPLPLKKTASFPANRQAVYLRTKNSLSRLKRDPQKLSQCTESMGKYLKNDQVEEITQLEINTEESTNYIPVFAVTHKKKNKIRLVFDSSATFNGKSLNKALLQGPDENNRIVGVMTRFRHGKVAFSSDIESMFHGFFVSPHHRNLLRFYWWSNNDPDNEVVPFRAKVHIFGNTSSPAIANFGLRYTTHTEEAQKYPEACRFIRNNFYVDDALGGAETIPAAVEILDKTRKILSNFNLRLHKIVSNRKEVLEAFPQSELAIETDTVNLSESRVERTLGVLWRVSTDELVLRCEVPDRQFTRRGVLSTVNSLYDPLGIVSPVSLTGRLLQRQVLSSRSTSSTETDDWDDPLPKIYLEPWKRWVDSLSNADEIAIPRCFSPPSFGKVIRREIHTYADASDDAIGCIIYLRLFDEKGNIYVAFLFGNSKVAPRAATSIPRLELCAAVEATHFTRHFVKELGESVDKIAFYSDSKVVLGYLNNTERRFSRYVTSRVRSILNTSSTDQWKYIHTKENPADIASRPHSPRELTQTRWFQGPEFLWQADELREDEEIELDLELPEVMQQCKTLQTSTVENDSVTTRICKKTNHWPKAKRILRNVIKFCNILLCRLRKNDKSETSNLLEDTDESATIIFISAAQQEHFKDSLQKMKKKVALQETDPLLGLSPFLDSNDIIRVGGRLSHSSLPFDNKHPVLLPTQGDITDMIFRHYHNAVYHQGRHISMGALRQGGYHLHKGRRTLDLLLKNCIVCRMFRGKLQTQKMADLPPIRLEEIPPFTNTGVDVFGPYLVHDGASTRRTNANKKVWATLFTCLSTRAIHIEPIPSMSTDAFRLALRRFLALRGQCKTIYSDQGTNFVGAKNELIKNIDFHAIESDSKIDLIWKFIPPAASHFGGVWERKVGSVKRVLNVALHQLGPQALSRDELHTLLQEAACIVNDTPLYEVSANPNDPFPITPNMLLTLKDTQSPPPLETIAPSDLLQYGGKRWRRVQYLKEQFFIRWRTNFLQTLQKRHKWKTPTPCVTIGDIVMIRKPDPRQRWPLGRIVNVEPGLDGLIRTATIQTGKNTLRRCIHDLVLLIPAEGHRC